MKKIFSCIVAIWTFQAFAIPCDCEVRVHSPLTGSNTRIEPVIIKNYELEEYSTFARKNIQSCQKSCLEEFHKDMPFNRLNALLISYSLQLVDQKAVGYNCTGLTTLKYPVRVRALLGGKGLGNVADLVQVVSHEEICF